jgi:hypothetical protein
MEDEDSGCDRRHGHYGHDAHRNSNPAHRPPKHRRRLHATEMVVCGSRNIRRVVGLRWIAPHRRCHVIIIGGVNVSAIPRIDDPYG